MTQIKGTTMRQPEDMLIDYLNGSKCNYFHEFMVLTELAEGLDVLSEREKSRVRLLRLWQIAMVEGAQREADSGAPVAELMIDIVHALGIVTAGLVVQQVASDKHMRKIGRELKDVFESGFRQFSDQLSQCRRDPQA